MFASCKRMTTKFDSSKTTTLGVWNPDQLPPGVTEEMQDLVSRLPYIYKAPVSDVFDFDVTATPMRCTILARLKADHTQTVRIHAVIPDIYNTLEMEAAQRRLFQASSFGFFSVEQCSMPIESLIALIDLIDRQRVDLQPKLRESSGVKHFLT